MFDLMCDLGFITETKQGTSVTKQGTRAGS